MYLAIARLNHSCEPNVQQTHIPETQEEVLYACRDIAIGDEINDCYIELRNSRSKRKEELRNLFRFECQCRACMMDLESSEADDKRRERSMKLEEYLFQQVELDPSAALGIADEALKLLNNPLCLGWSARYIAGMNFSAYQIAFELGKKKRAKQYLLDAYQSFLTFQGPSSPETRRASSLLKASGHSIV